MAGLTPAAVICEVMNEDGTMARLPDLLLFAEAHQLKVGTIASLIEYRGRNETLIERVGQRPLQTPQGEFNSLAYRDRSGGVHLALTHGRWGSTDEVLVRVHEPLTVLDLLDAEPRGHSWSLLKALRVLRAGERGAAVLLNCGDGLAGVTNPLQSPTPTRGASPSPNDLRTYGIGAQILRDIGIGRMKLLGSPRRMPSMMGYGLEVTGYLAADA
jgi:3,4-dihydroxy 2-butanone 4-phosphate synthase/GTP cyclohydrolase II